MADDGIESTEAGTASRFSSDDDPGGGVLGDHVAGVDAGVVREERRQAVVAGHVAEPVGAALAHRGDVGRGDREEVEHVAHRGAVEVAVGLHPAVDGDHRVVDGRGQLAAGHPGRVVDGVARRPVHRRGAAQRVGVLHAGALGTLVAGHDRRAGQHQPQVRGARRLAGVRAQRHQVGGEGGLAAEQRLDAQAAGDVGHDEQVPQVGQREHQHAEHPVGAVDERQPLLLGELDRLDPVLAQGDPRVEERAGGVAHVPLPHQRERAVRQRGEVAGAAERAVLVHDRGEAGVDHRGVRLRGGRPHAGASGGEGRQPQQHQRRAPPRARPRPPSRPRGSGSGCAATRLAARWGCAWWPGRRSRWRCRSAARGRRPAPR